MLAAVNDYQESIDNPAGKAKPLKRQRKIFADPGRELSRAEYFRLLNAARETGNKRTQLLLETICSTGIRVSELQYITLEAVRPAQSEHTLQRQMQRNSVAGRTLPPSDALVSAQAHPCGGGFPFPRGKPLSRVTVWKLLKALCERANVAWKKGLSHNLRHLFAQDLL